MIVRANELGEWLGLTLIDNDPLRLSEEIGKAVRRRRWCWRPPNGWYWATDVLAEAGAHVHLAHLLGIKGFQASTGEE
ncbi:hypothetical protein [Saccharopolyspora hattusasensis]|uniref:hypothetical protein n=1 Tax=Saccharopolyspora hattusasensis TaxID=1128679 RepID=UPI003D9511E8